MTVQNGIICTNEDSTMVVRPLVIARGPARVSIPVSTVNEEWIAAEVLKEEFSHSINGTSEVAVADPADASASKEAEALLLADFLGFVAKHRGQVCSTSVLLASLTHFTRTHLAKTDVHSFVATFDAESRKSILSSYFVALSTLENSGKVSADQIPRAPSSALLAAAANGDANIYALFGGQGTNEVYFDELRNLYEIYQPYVVDLITQVSKQVLDPLAVKAEADGYSYYTYGMDVISWLNGSAPVPPVDYLASIPISFPLIGLTQLVQFLAACRASNLSPGEMRQLMKGATGHSQGIVSAVCIAASNCLDSFVTNVQKSLTWLFYSGLRGQEAFPVLSIDPQLVKDSVEGGEGVPTPMLSVTGLALDVLEKHIAGTNKHLASNSKMGISLYNGPRAFVITGPARSLYGLVTSLRKIRAPTGLDQSKIPFSQRKAVFSVRFLTVGVPYHSPYLEGVTEKVTKVDLEGQELWTPEDLQIPVYHTEDGSDLSKLSGSLTQSLCDQIFTMPIHWNKATGFPDTATHAVDFGPGGLSGIGGLTARNLEGRGVRVIIIGERGKGSSELYTSSGVRYESWWTRKFAPKLIKTSDGKMHIDTPFSRLLGKAPIMVAGMTPTTVKAGFVSAVLSAGYHIELAGGGHYNPAALRKKVAEIQSKIPPGVGLTLNSLYINPRQFGFQLPLWQELRREGVPVEGFCVAAGIPSAEKAAEIISGLQAAGIRHVSFKPGSVEGIRQVVSIAAANPDFPVILQWTGGRAGGHHSCEDFHQPVLQTYAAIRQQPNISLIAGSGFGGSDDVWPYLTGEWSQELFGVQPMPFDGFLFASRVMVAKEAHTSESVKQLIVAASGVDDKDWEGTYTRETGGILTVNSELGEPIHKIATRGVKLWKEFDDTVFKLPKDKRAAWLAQNKKSVIEKLNRDFAKPWFAQKKDGTVVDDIGEMTYEEVVLRMIRLMFVSHEERWIDISLRNLTGDFCRRVEERFAGEMRPSILQSYLELDKPHEFVQKFFKTYPVACEQLVASEDAAYFLAISQRPGQKPVPFIPVLDADFGVWFKKDSLWAAEDIEAVFDQDPQRVCILQGPVAVKHSVKANEPIKELLGNIEEALKSKLLAAYYDGDESNVPVVDYLGEGGSKISNTADEYGIQVTSEGDASEYKVGSALPPVDQWLDTLAGPSLGWLRALLSSPTIVQGKSYIDNPLRRLFAPRTRQRVIVKPNSITLYGAGRSYGPHPEDFEAVSAVYDASSSQVTLTMSEERGGVSVPLTLLFHYRPDQGFAPIHEVVEDRNNRIKDFYWRLWFGDDRKMPALDSRQVFEGPEITVDAQEIERFCSVVKNEGEVFKSARFGKVQAPLDFAIVTGWQAIIQAIFPESIDGDLLKLVHLSNEFKMVPGAKPLYAGDTCKSEARIASVTNTDAGKAVKVTGVVKRDGQPIIEVTSSFLYRGRFTDFNQTFDIVKEDDYMVELETHADVAVLQSKEWFQWDNDAKPLQAGTKLIFRVTSDVVHHDKSSFSSISVKGHAYVRNQLKELIQVATIDYSAARTFGNPVSAYLQRHGKAEGRTVPFENGGYTLTSSSSPSTFRAPSTNEPYSKISRDFNPIHVNPYFSDFASLPATITHGMWSSAATRKYVETIAAKNHPERVLAYNVTFVGMVIPGDELTVNLKHIGMRDGAMVLKVVTTNQRGEKVLEGGAEVAQPATVYAFTGQGSQEPGMGMELYASSPAARAVWDTADEHLLAVYGFSIIDIVKNNPKTKTIHFGGIKGQTIRERYMKMSYDALDKDGNVKTLPLFADIDIRTPLYTFSHPAGLLFATQFAQIALVVTEKASFEDMRSKGLIQKGCAFAGHSLGEYSALASIADVLAIPALVDVVFYRGITMQRAVERDGQNRSNYAMCAVNPSRIGKTFDDAALREVVETISSKTGLLLQIVNFNVEGQQYVCAGELVALETLTNVLNYLKVEKVDIAKLLTKFSLDKVKEMLGDITEGSFEKAQAKKKSEGFIKLERGFATIPLPGIDVPFHSRYLWAGVMPFRAYLSKKINAAQLNPDMLIGQYVPNLIAEPFQVSLEYAQRIYDQTSSPTLEKIIENWESENWASQEKRQHLAYAILVELLAYQFASPVKWIQTQDIFFTQYSFERFIEIGPGPTLTGMATRTLKAKYEAADDSVSRTRLIYCHAKNPKEIYYQFEDEAEAAETAAPTDAALVASAAAPVAAPIPVAVAAPSASGPVAQIPDEPMRALDTLLVIIAQKLKKKVEEIPTSKAIKDLVGGKSTLQNEILGDLQLEFSSAPEKGEELPLDELGAALSAGYTGALGKYTTGMVSRLVGGKMPGGFNLSAIKAYLNKQWGLGPTRADAALLLGITLEPPKRLGSEAEAKAWLDTVAAAYAKQAGISLSAAGSAGGGGGGGGAVMNSEEFLKFKAEQEEFAARHIELYMRYLGRDSRAGGQAYDEEKANSLKLQAKLDDIAREHGDTYVQGILPVFDPLKARHFDSAWNWVRQDALLMFYDIIFGRLTTVDREITARCIAIMNRADPALLKYMQYHIDHCDPGRGETYKLAKEFGQRLIDNCSEAVGHPPVYKDVNFPTAPHTEVTKQGDIVYKEVMREDCRKMEAYVHQMSGPSSTAPAIDVTKLSANLANLWKLVQNQPEISEEQRTRIKSLYDGVVRSLHTAAPEQPRPRPGSPRSRRSSSQFLRPQIPVRPPTSEDRVPLLHLKRKIGSQWEYSGNLTSLYLDVLTEIATSGTTFKDKNALLTGVGKGSIGVEIVKGLLSGGARVVITTSRYSRSSVEYYQDIYHRYGSDGSALTVVPFNQGSRQDVEALVDYIYTTLAMDLDYILPFAGIPENGREIDGLDDKSELAHRIMLTNLYRLMGAVKTKKASRNFVTRPTQVVLPLSPNHGLFGNDGLYPESKIALENLFTRWSSESWGEYLCLAGAVIGWTRGTGLMAPTNIVAQQLEGYGVRTFSPKEMAFNILGLMHPLLFSITQVEPIWADLSGAMNRADLAELTTRIRKGLLTEGEKRKAISRDTAVDYKIINGQEAERVLQTVNVSPRANFKFDFPTLEESSSLKDLEHLRGMIDLDKVVVITGFAEVGPWGGSRTRWEMEARGEFTIEGCIEMAWMMGYIKHHNGRLKNGELYVGWVDTKSGEPVSDSEVKKRYEKDILAHSGIRLVEPELFNGYDPNKKTFYQEIQLNHDLEPLEVSEAEARKFKLQHEDKCDIWTQPSGEWFAKLKKGSRIIVPKSFKFDRLVAGQIPTGWSAGRYGLPDDIIAQTDRTALWALVCTAEALTMSGINDPYELYKYVHPSEVGSSLGSGMGGTQSIAAMFKDRREEKDVQMDIFQETYINTVAGWVNLLLMSSSGPIKIPVGACATALQSLEIACDTLLSGKAKVMIAGGFDDFSEEGSFEFANMKATSNAVTEFAMGREPNEMSRPTTSTRAGFMEAQGTGVQILMTASTAIKMGATIRGIVGFTSTSTDKAGRSIPAPGRGVLTIARELTPETPLPILDIKYRARQLAFRRRQIAQWAENERELLEEEAKACSGESTKAFVAARLAHIEEEAARQEKDALSTYGMLQGADPRIAPLRRALAVWGLNADDIGVVSIHGTSTKANDKNESHVYNDIFRTLQRTPGNAVPVIAQKNLTGHSKGGAAAWMLIGITQSINTGIVPGNRNADNIDSQLRQFEFLMYPSKTIRTDGIRAGLMTSFGFGQVGGSVLVLHPRYLFGCLEPAQYEAYRQANRIRSLGAYKVMSEMMITNSLVKIKAHPPFTPELEGSVLLNPLARVTRDKVGELSFPPKLTKAPSVNLSNLDVMSTSLDKAGDSAGVGVDHELISSVPSHNPTFVSRNFTEKEISYCQSQPDPAASFAARWAGKEAVFKSLGVSSKGAAAAMRDIEILPDQSGVPQVHLHGAAQEAASARKVGKVQISLSHSETMAIAFAQATF